MHNNEGDIIWNTMQKYSQISKINSKGLIVVWFAIHKLKGANWA